MPEVTIKGNGVAACCCASLLSQSQCKVFFEKTARAGSPVLMLSDQTQRLLGDVFGVLPLFQDAIRINRRVVRWGANSEPVTLPHSGLVMPESLLLETLWPSIKTEDAAAESADHWAVISSKAALPAVTQHRFGSRMAVANSVTLDRSASRDSCWVESTSGGWLFLLPSGNDGGSLISVGDRSDVLLQESTLVVGQIKELGPSTGSFPAFPGIVSPLCDARWIACGSAAVAFDPIAGEGAGNAIREGILAAAVIRAVVTHPQFQDDLLAHYSNRILSGFLRHLQECCHFYGTGHSTTWWRQELESLMEGVAWTRSELSSNPAGKFRLAGFELQSVTA